MKYTKDLWGAKFDIYVPISELRCGPYLPGVMNYASLPGNWHKAENPTQLICRVNSPEEERDAINLLTDWADSWANQMAEFDRLWAIYNFKEDK